MNTLKDLAELAGISSSYVDKTGKTQVTNDEVRKFFLKAMKIKAESQTDIDESVKELSVVDVLPKVMAFFDNETIRFNIKKEGKFEIVLTDENNKEVWSGKCDGFEDVIIQNLPTGYFDIVAKGDNEVFESMLIHAPEMCYLPEFIKNNEHLYGVSLMLYALKSDNSIGIGDFGDLAEIVKLTAENGGDAVGINPLGVMSPHTLPNPMFGEMLKGDVSPYRSLSRAFFNYVYLDLRSESDFKLSGDIQNLIRTPEVVAEIRRLNDSNNVLYGPVLLLKRRFLEMMYQHFMGTNDLNRKEEFEAYKKQKGVELYNLCLFEVLLEKHPEESFWRYWRDGTSDINSDATQRFAETYKTRIDFYAYCHWLADKQVKGVQELAKKMGMKIGLYTDMPIGAGSNGVEVWENPEAYVLDAGIGAPADPMRPKGQSWGFTPYHPRVLKEQKYKPFINLVRENLGCSGALRIDHAMGLRRLFWGYFAEGNPVLQGAYIYYDMKALTTILSIESNRAKCLMIGEDLGTVPEGFREYMAEHGLLSYKVFFRQKEKDGSFIKPKDYMYMSLAQSSTHDQATSCGFWINEDIEVFKRCGLYVNYEQYMANLDGRRKDRVNMIKAFVDENLLTPGLNAEMERTVEKGNAVPVGIEKPVNAYGAKTNSALYFVRLCDIYAQEKLDNAPGTIDEYANWRLRLSHDINMIKSTPAFADTLKQIKKYRPKKVA